MWLSLVSMQHRQRDYFIILTRLMAHFRVEIRMASDDDQLNKKHAIITGKSVDRMEYIFKCYCIKSQWIWILCECLPFLYRFVWLAVVSLRQSSTQFRPWCERMYALYCIIVPNVNLHRFHSIFTYFNTKYNRNNQNVYFRETESIQC